MVSGNGSDELMAFSSLNISMILTVLHFYLSSAVFTDSFTEIIIGLY